MSGSLEAAPARSSAAILPRLGLRFALTYALIATIAFSIYAFPFELFGAQGDWLASYLQAYARLAGGVLQLFDSTVTVIGDRIDGRFALQIVRNCDAIEINILFASAVLAFPASLVRRGKVLLKGVALLVAANVSRICCLYYIGVYFPSWFGTAHEEVLPLLLVMLTALLFLAAAHRLAEGEPNAVQASAP